MVGPVIHPNTVTTIADDGRYHHRVRQSFLNSFANCAEAARRDMNNLFIRRETDATAVGTAVHAAIEEALMYTIEDGVHLGVAECLELFHSHWQNMQTELDIKFVKRKLQGATSFGERCIATWAEYVAPTLDPIATEIGFSNLTVFEDDKRIVTCSGTMDYADHGYLGDWKTSSRRYEPWEKQRWAVQPTTYFWALRNDPDLEWLRAKIPDGKWKFIVMVDNNDPTPQIIDVDRPPEWDAWFVRQVQSLVPLLEANLEVWPMNDNQALCSPTWCESWSVCKGAHITEAPWVVKHKKSLAKALEG